MSINIGGFGPVVALVNRVRDSDGRAVPLNGLAPTIAVLALIHWPIVALVNYSTLNQISQEMLDSGEVEDLVAYFEGEYVPLRDAKVSIMTHAFMYGTAVFEGIRAYDTPNGPKVFRLTDHLKRLFASARSAGTTRPSFPRSAWRSGKMCLRNSPTR